MDGSVMKNFILSKKVWIPLLILLIYTPWSAKLDQLTSNFFYHNGRFLSHPFFNWFYDYGIYFAWVLAAVAILVWVNSFFVPKFKKWRRIASFLILTLTLGSGLTIHAFFKDHWGRPRPRQVIEYGGQQSFRPYYQPNFFAQPEPSKSFPCGHCSMGFYFFALALVGKHYRSKMVYRLGMALGWGLGSFLGLARMAQGGHFLSDVFVSGLIMWLVSLGLYRFMFPKLQGV
jgi:membrane-associated PAP2 superfamily phosphatase